MSRKSSNSWSHFGMRERDGAVVALPFSAWTKRDGDGNSRIDWHTLDLQRAETSGTLSTMPPEAPEGGTAIAWRNHVYVVGGVCDCDCRWGARCRHTKIHGTHALDDAFYFDSEHPQFGWRTAPPMLCSRRFPAAVATQGKIYVFGKNKNMEGHFAEVFDISRNRWDLLPGPSALDVNPRGVSDTVHLDSPRSRILVRFFGCSLYAFHVHTESWECVDKKFGRYDATTLVDNVLYCLLHPYTDDLPDPRECFLAYDVVDYKWLPVMWLTECPFPAPGAGNLFHLGKGQYCLICYRTAMADICYFEYVKLSLCNDSGVIYATAESESTIIVPFQGDPDHPGADRNMNRNLWESLLHQIY